MPLKEEDLRKIIKSWYKDSGMVVRIESPISPGFPDLLIINGSYTTFVELKIARLDKERIEPRFQPGQIDFANKIKENGGEYWLLIADPDDKPINALWFNFAKPIMFKKKFFARFSSTKPWCFP